jgi:hypothetical protein
VSTDVSIGSHQRSVGRSQVHITPKWILDALGEFDLDPAAATVQPWNCARHNFIEADNGLSRPWRGRVFLNPPYDRYQVAAWIQKLAEHNHGIALLHVRTETEFLPIWQHASGILFMANRIHFHLPDGTRHPANSGAPVCLVSFGAADLECLRSCGIAGVLVTSWKLLNMEKVK